MLIVIRSAHSGTGVTMLRRVSIERVGARCRIAKAIKPLQRRALGTTKNVGATFPSAPGPCAIAAARLQAYRDVQSDGHQTRKQKYTDEFMGRVRAVCAILFFALVIGALVMMLAR
jgi:hypothetical protein